MKYAFVKNHQTTHAIRRMCTLLDVSPAGYYEWFERGPSERSKHDIEITGVIREIHSYSRKTYDVPRVHAELCRLGENVGRRRVAKLMKAAGIKGCIRGSFQVKTTNSQHDYPISPNLLDRIFRVPTLGTHWVSDLTYIPTREGWLYLAVVLDLGNRSIVGCSFQENLERKIVIDALKSAVLRRQPLAGCIFHSDRGSQYASSDFRSALFRYRMRQSMSGSGQCWDNAVAERFFGSMKSEIGLKIWQTRAEARAAIFEYIEIWYNRKRTDSTLGYLSPRQYEKKLLKAA